LPVIRSAIRTERKLLIRYLDGHGRDSKRTIWPFALGFFDRVRVVVAWRGLREGFRHFRTDHISKVQVVRRRTASAARTGCSRLRRLVLPPERHRRKTS